MKSPNIDFGVFIPVDKIKLYGDNPPNRTSKRSLKSLADSIGKDGIKTPLTVTKDHVLADGHRRLACAKMLGIAEVPCNVHKDIDDEKVLFSISNQFSKPLKGVDYLQLYKKGLREIPEKHMKNIKRLEELSGAALFSKIERSPDFVSYVDSVVRLTSPHFDSVHGVRSVILWVDLICLPGPCHSALKAGVSKEKFIDAIKNWSKLDV